MNLPTPPRQEQATGQDVKPVHQDPVALQQVLWGKVANGLARCRVGPLKKWTAARGLVPAHKGRSISLCHTILAHISRGHLAGRPDEPAILLKMLHKRRKPHPAQPDLPTLDQLQWLLNSFSPSVPTVVVTPAQHSPPPRVEQQQNRQDRHEQQQETAAMTIAGLAEPGRLKPATLVPWPGAGGTAAMSMFRVSRSPDQQPQQRRQQQQSHEPESVAPAKSEDGHGREAKRARGATGPVFTFLHFNPPVTASAFMASKTHGQARPARPLPREHIESPHAQQRGQVHADPGDHVPPQASVSTNTTNTATASLASDETLGSSEYDDREEEEEEEGEQETASPPEPERAYRTVGPAHSPISSPNLLCRTDNDPLSSQSHRKSDAEQQAQEEQDPGQILPTDDKATVKRKKLWRLHRYLAQFPEVIAPEEGREVPDTLVRSIMQDVCMRCFGERFQCRPSRDEPCYNSLCLRPRPRCHTMGARPAVRLLCPSCTERYPQIHSAAKATASKAMAALKAQHSRLKVAWPEEWPDTDQAYAQQVYANCGYEMDQEGYEAKFRGLAHKFLAPKPSPK
jgi:hypothetical protein